MHRPGESKGVPLEVRDFGAGDEDVLASASFCLLLFDLELHHIRGVLDNFRNEGIVTRANLTQYALEDPYNTTDEPIFL